MRLAALRQHHYPGCFIVFEGGEGTGKTTQIKRLHEKLIGLGRAVVVTREPGGTDCPIAEKIRAIIKDPANKDMLAVTEFFLFLASRAQHVRQLVIPALEAGKIVICDRFDGSTIAYQHFARGLFDLLKMIHTNELATSGLVPNMTIYLDIEPEIGLKRKGDVTADRLDSESLEFHRKVRDGYLAIAEMMPNWHVLSAKKLEDAVFESIWALVSATQNI